ncbi:meiotically up-regulated 190 protein, partial [Lentinula aciculospora]
MSPQREEKPSRQLNNNVEKRTGKHKAAATPNEREVTDPITHFPITIHDNTSIELEQISPPRSDSKATEGMSNEETNKQRHIGLEQVVREETNKGWWEEDNHDRTRTAIVAGLSVSVGVYSTLILLKILGRVFGTSSSVHGFGILDIFIASVACTLLSMTAGFVVLRYETRDEKNHKEKPWTKPFTQEKPETAVWLNSFLDTLWPIVNPALFTAVSDMLEDSLQATLPKMIHAVRVADIGQGSEPLRILGIRWLDGADATQAHDGMAAEEGDFVNFEAAVAYRARSSSSSLKGRSANLHLLMQFWITGGFVLPVWVEITGIISTARVRVHLTPNPPFLSLMTLTLMGQPKVTLTATPLAKNFLNVMDIPGLSSWLQKSIDAAISEYVAPRSLSLDLKTVLMGREKMDTEARGVVWITVKSAEGFKNGDGIEIWKSENGRKGDVYVTASWAKWGKPLWSTRIIQNEANPIWDESTALLVAPSEVNAQEKLKLQLWDSDRFTADDNLGTIELPLLDIMNSPETCNRIGHRQNRFLADDGKSEWPGSLTWSIGYFAKTTLEQHIGNKEGENVQELEHSIEEQAKNKLREAETRKQGEKASEVEQQKKQDLRERTEEIVSGSPPTREWPAGILSVRIEQITGVEVDNPRQSGSKGTKNGEDGIEEEEGDDMPSPYCTIIINHAKVYKTRTKMKANNPYYDAGTERFIKSWPTTVVMIAVRDSRLHEVDPLIGVVVLPLQQLFAKRGRSQITDTFPLVGGMGYGRLKCSLMFRSVQIQPSLGNFPKASLGWDVGTLEIKTETMRASHDLPGDLRSARVLLRTLYGRDKVLPTDSYNGWHQKKDRPVRMAVKNRFASCLLIQFRKTALGPDKTPAFGTLWLKDLPDIDEVTVRIAVRRNEGNAMVSGRFNASEDIGRKVGELEMRVQFWPGLSRHHHWLADQDPAMADVMEVLDAAEESEEVSKKMLYEEELDG